MHTRDDLSIHTDRAMAILLYLIFLVLGHSFFTEAQQYALCEGGNYTASSTFGSNLNLLLSNLSSSNATFTTATIGAFPDRVYGLVLCRGDLNSSSCNTCFKMVSHNVTQLCPHSEEATVWDRNCELRYSNISFFNSIDTPEVVEMLYNDQNGTDTFANMSRELFKNTSYQAAFNSSRMFATGMLSYGESTIYSLAQCTMDLSRDLCKQCLNQTLDVFWNINYRAKIGVWLFGKSCNYRYEVAPFYFGRPTIVLTLPSLSPSPSPSLSPTPTPTPLFSPPKPLFSPPTTGEAPSQNRGGKKNTCEVLNMVISLAVAVVFVQFTSWK